MFPLFKRQIRIRRKFFILNQFPVGKGMFSADKYVRFCYKQGMKFQVMGFQNLLNHRFIKVILK